MKRHVAMVWMLSLLFLLLACGSVPVGDASSPTPFPMEEDDGEYMASVKPAEHIPEGVSATYQEVRNGFTQMVQEEEPDFVLEGEAIGIVLNETYALYVPLARVWQVDMDEKVEEVMAMAAYDPSGRTQIWMRIMAPQELPWLTVTGGEDGKGVMISTSDKDLAEHAKKYFEAYIEEYLEEHSLGITKEAKMMRYSCCQGPMLHFAGTIGEETVMGAYGIFGNEMGSYEFFLVAPEEYIDIAREEFYFYLSNVGHFLRSQEEFESILARLQQSHPKR